MSSDIKMGLWDIRVDNGAENPFHNLEWSEEFRQMLGYQSEAEYPNVLESWSDLLHPDHKQITLDAFQEALGDTSGMTIYDVEYLLANKAGEYQWYRAAGDVERDADLNAVRIVGSLYDIAEERAASGDTEWRHNGRF